MRKFYIILIFLCLFASKAYSANRFVYCGEDATGDIWFIDTQTIQYNPVSRITSFWTKTIHSEKSSVFKYIYTYARNKEERKRFSRIVYSMEHFYIDMNQNLIAPMRVLYYAFNGELIYSGLNQQFPEWGTIVPNSVGETLFRYLKRNLIY